MGQEKRGGGIHDGASRPSKPAPKFLTYHEAFRVFGLLVKAQRLLGERVIEGKLSSGDQGKLEDVLDELREMIGPDGE